MKPDPLVQLGMFGQALWLDDSRRDLITDGALRRLIEEDGLRGMTSNPAIFAKAIEEALGRHDVQNADDDLRPLYDRTEGKDGSASLEVSPLGMRDTEARGRGCREVQETVRRAAGYRG